MHIVETVNRYICDRCGTTRDVDRPEGWIEIELALAVTVKGFPLSMRTGKTIGEMMAEMLTAERTFMKSRSWAHPYRTLLLCTSCLTNHGLDQRGSGSLPLWEAQLEEVLKRRLDAVVDDAFGIPASLPELPDGDGPGEDRS